MQVEAAHAGDELVFGERSGKDREVYLFRQGGDGLRQVLQVEIHARFFRLRFRPGCGGHLTFRLFESAGARRRLLCRERIGSAAGDIEEGAYR